MLQTVLKCTASVLLFLYSYQQWVFFFSYTRPHLNTPILVHTRLPFLMAIRYFLTPPVNGAVDLAVSSEWGIPVILKFFDHSFRSQLLAPFGATLSPEHKPPLEWLHLLSLAPDTRSPR